MVRVSGGLYGLCALVAVSATLAVGCTEPATRIFLDVQIDADSEVRSRVKSVDITVELQSGEGWRQRQEQRNEPSFLSWPIRFSVGPERPDGNARYQLLATARDERFAVIAQARTILTQDRARRSGLRAVFETACLDLPKLCESGTTCSAGECIDAELAPTGGTGTATHTNPTTAMPDAGAKPSEDGIAEEGAACSSDGERRCSSFASALPLRCESGMWAPQVECTSAERCDTSESATRGTCRDIADECRGQEAGVPFCESDMMRVCDEDLLRSAPRMCSDNEQCRTDPQKGAVCACRSGYVAAKDGVGCEQSTDCVNNGGCDPLTKCSIGASGPECSECPAGYNGTGKAGCVPSLMDLSVKEAQITPTFTPGTTEYRVHVSILTQRVSLVVRAPSESQITVNGTAAMGDTWTSDVLALGDNKLDVVVASGFGMSRAYRVVVDRSADEQTFIKASNPRQGAAFAATISAAGDTIIAAAPIESSAGSGVNPPPTSDQSEYSGAVYVFVNRGGTWVQEAFLKASDAAAEDFFGSATAVFGDTLFVGATKVSIAQPVPGTQPGVVYVFTRANGVWTEVAKITSGQSNGDGFGSSLAFDGKTLAIGSLFDGTLIAGSAYVYTGSGANWTQLQKFTAPAANRPVVFGSAVAVSGDTFAVSAEDDQTEQYRGGAVYVYVRSGSRYMLQQRLTADPVVMQGLFGFALDLRGDLLVAGSPKTSSSGTPPPGEVHVFERAQGKWSRSMILKNPLNSPGDNFGWAARIGPDFIAVGAITEAGDGRGWSADPTSRGSDGAGAVYLFAKSDDTWKLSTYIKAANAGPGDNFGAGLVILENRLVVAATGEGSSGKGINPTSTDKSTPGSGAFYVYH